jgi:hypothetical protein
MNSLRRLAIAAAVASFAGAAAADPRQPPTVEFTADAVHKSEGEPDSTYKIAYSKNRVRVDMSGQGEASVMIVDRVKKQMTVLLPATKQYQVMSLPGGADPFSPLGKGFQATKVGEESIGDTPATKWAVSGNSEVTGPMKGTVWTSKENIQLRAEGEVQHQGKTLKFSNELKNIKIGAIDPKLFALPQGYKPAPKQ